MLWPGLSWSSPSQTPPPDTPQETPGFAQTRGKAAGRQRLLKALSRHFSRVVSVSQRRKKSFRRWYALGTSGEYVCNGVPGPWHKSPSPEGEGAANHASGEGTLVRSRGRNASAEPKLFQLFQGALEGRDKLLFAGHNIAQLKLAGIDAGKGQACADGFVPTA